MLVQWCPTLVQCGRSGVTVKREVARSNTRDVGGDSTVGQGPALGRQKAHNIAGLLIVSSSGCLGLRPFDPLLFEDLMSKLMGLLIVGVAGFEPTTSSSRTKRATKLRHTPCAAGDSIASTHRGEEIGSAESSVTSAFAPRGNPVGPRRPP